MVLYEMVVDDVAGERGMMTLLVRDEGSEK